MARRKKNPNQEELKNMPKPGPLVNKAIELLDARDELEQAKLKSDEVKSALIKLFVKEGKTSVKVEGCTIFYSHLETDQIKVKQSE